MVTNLHIVLQSLKLVLTKVNSLILHRQLTNIANFTAMSNSQTHTHSEFPSSCLACLQRHASLLVLCFCSLFNLMAADTDTTLTKRQDMSKFELPITIKTNMLSDVAAIPSIGVEAHVSQGYSVAAIYWNSWWSSKSRHRCWRTYGFELAGRYWLGRHTQKALHQGHHIGLYAQILLYDFEWGGKGYLSGEPGKNLFHHPTYGIGAEYGFSLAISSCLNLDFVIGFGYLGGQYSVYKPIDGHFAWLRTKQRRWLGPTKAEISLAWHIPALTIKWKKGGSK